MSLDQYQPPSASPPSPQPAPLRAAQYVRMSTEHQQYSTNNQADKILEYAQRRNIEIVRTYADEGKSGLSLGGRASLQKLIADAESGGYSAEIIIQKTGLSPKYVKDIVFLLDQGEERLIEGVQRGAIPLTTALEIARAKDGDENLGDMLQEAYENGQLKGRQIIEAKRLIEKRQEHGPASPNADQIKPPASSYSLVRTYQKEVDRQRKMVLKAEHAHQRLLLVVQGLKKLFADESFVNLLRAEGLDTLPKYLSDRISAPDITVSPSTSINTITTPQPELEGESA